MTDIIFVELISCISAFEKMNQVDTFRNFGLELLRIKISKIKMQNTFQDYRNLNGIEKYYKFVRNADIGFSSLFWMRSENRKTYQ